MLFRSIRILSIGIRARSLILGFTALRVKMSTRGFVHNEMFIFNGTNYDIWKTRMLIHFRDMDPNLESIVDIDFSPPMDFENLSCEDEKNLYLDAQASNVLVNALSYVVTSSIIPFWSAHDLWKIGRAHV